MLTQTSVPGTDDWWVMRLAAQYGADLPRLYRMQSYADGTNALPDEWDTAMREAYRRYIHQARLNMAELIVSARVNRMKPLGFRTAAPNDDNGDQLALAHWNRSHMRLGARDLFTDAGVLGQAYLTVTGPQQPSADAQPMILRSNGWSTAVSPYATTPWLAEAAVQVGYDPMNGVDTITLFRPGYMRIAVRVTRVSSLVTNGSAWDPGRGWEWATDPVQLGYTDQVPVTMMAGPGGKGMFEKHTDSLDRITGTIRERLTISAIQAFRQRGIEGKLPREYPPDHPLAGQLIDYDEIYKAGPAALWMLPDGAKIWESSVVDITPILNATKDDTKHLAATSSTPLYILSPDAANGSAEGASLAREALTFSAEEWLDRAEDPIDQALATCFRAQGDAVRSDVGAISTIWAPVDRTSITEKAQAASQAVSTLSKRTIWEKVWQMTPAEIEAEQQRQQDEQFQASLTTT